MKQTTCTLIVATSLLGACAEQPAKPAATLNAEALEKVRKIAIVPVEVEYKIIDPANTARQPETEQTVSRTLTAHLAERLKQRNFIVRLPDDNLPEAEKHALQGEVAELRFAYRSAVKRGPGSDPEDAEDSAALGTFVGKIAVGIAARMDADAVLLVRYTGFSRSENQIAQDVAANIAIGLVTGALTGVIVTRRHAREGGTADVALIDGIRGEVIWTGRGRYALAAMGQRMNFARPWAQRYASSATGAVSDALVSLPPTVAPPAPAVRAAEDPAPVTLSAPAATLVPISTAATPTPRRGKDPEVVFWESVRDSNNPEELKAYLERYPNGVFAPVARARLSALGR